MSREKLAIGDRVVASLVSKTVGEIVDKNAFGEVLVAWPDGKTNWIKRRHLLLEVEVDFMQPPKPKILVARGQWTAIVLTPAQAELMRASGRLKDV